MLTIVWPRGLRVCLADLTVLDYLNFAIDPTNNTDSLVRGDFFHHFVARFGLFLDAVAHKNWIGHLDQDVVHTVDVEIFDSDLRLENK
jgi:hypothetical protein